MRRAVIVFALSCASPRAVALDGNVDSGSGSDLPACTGDVYDPCTSGSQCQSGMCHDFIGSMIEVCTTTCSTETPCPMQGSAIGFCSGMDICKPPMPNACTR
jgi:hypothetical protein